MARVLIRCSKCGKELVKFETDKHFQQRKEVYCNKCYKKISKKIEKIKKVTRVDEYYNDDSKEIERIKKRINAIIK